MATKRRRMIDLLLVLVGITLLGIAFQATLEARITRTVMIRRSGMGTIRSNGMGTIQPNGMGTDQPNGMGTDQPNGMGTDQPNGMGTDQPNGMGTTRSRTPSTFRPCPCETKWVRKGDNLRRNFDHSLSWLNLTVKEDLKRHHPNLPVDFFYQAANQTVCDILPSFNEISWINQFWQETQLSDGSTFYLYSAVYDPNIGVDGGGGGEGGEGVRLLGMTTALDPPSDWCHIWYSPGDPPVASRVTSVVYLEPLKTSDKRQLPYLVTCPMVPGESRMPLVVSLVTQPCAVATNILRVVGGYRERTGSAYKNGVIPEDLGKSTTEWVPAVCGPALYYYNEDFSQRLVEWLELLRAEGFGRVFLYRTDVHPNIDKVLRHYEDEGFIEVTDYQYPPHYANMPSLRKLWKSLEYPKMFGLEKVYFNDCVLRHMHQHRFIAHYDPDEVPILPGYQSYSHLMRDYLELTRSQPEKVGFGLSWSFFYDEPRVQNKAADPPAPDFLWALRHTTRYSAGPGNRKAMYDMDKVRGVFSHGTLWCTFGPCRLQNMVVVPKEKGYLAHYQPKCWYECEDNHVITEETWLLRYKDQVTQAAEGVLRQLKLL